MGGLLTPATRLKHKIFVNYDKRWKMEVYEQRQREKLQGHRSVKMKDPCPLYYIAV